MDNTVRVQVSVAAPTSPQGEFRNSSPSFRGAVCICTLRLLYASQKCKTLRSSFSLRCKTVAHSLIFTPRVRLAPPFCKANLATALRSFGELFAYTPCGSFARRKMQDVHSLLVFRSAAKLSLPHHSHVVHPLLGQSAYSDGAGQRGRKKRSVRSAFCVLLFLRVYILAMYSESSVKMTPRPYAPASG